MLVLFNNGIQAVVGLATTYVLYHYLSIVETGMYYFVLSFVGLCEAGRYGFLATATVKFYAGTDKERGQTVLGSVWLLAIFLSVIIMLINGVGLLLLPYTNNPELILCIKWIGITYLSTLPADVIFWRLQAEEKYAKMFLYRMLNGITTIIAFIILVMLHRFTLETALIWNFLTNCIASLIGILWNFSGLKTIVHRSRDCVMEIFHYGKYTFVTTSISSILANADIWIINFIFGPVLGPTYVAVYNLANRFMQFVDLPLRTFITTGMSEMAISYNKKNMQQVTYIYKKYTGMLTLAFIPFNLIIFGVGIVAIKIIGGPQYNGPMLLQIIGAYGLLLIISVSYPIDRFNGLALDIIHKTKVNSYKVIIMLVVKIATGLLFAWLLKNIYGIVISTFLMTIAAIFYGYYQLRKSLDFTIPGILSLGYTELKVLIRKTLKLTAKT